MSEIEYNPTGVVCMMVLASTILSGEQKTSILSYTFEYSSTWLANLKRLSSDDFISMAMIWLLDIASKSAAFLLYPNITSLPMIMSGYICNK